MDWRYIALGVVVLLVLVFIKKLWKLALVLAALGVLYWYFIVR